MFRVTHKEERFYDMFVETVDLACAAAEKLDDLMTNYVNVREKINEIEEIEHQCDQSVHNIMKQLNRSFVTPIDREDINEVATGLDDITDAIEAAAHRFRMYNVEFVTEDAKALSKLIVASTKELRDVMIELKNMKTSKILLKKIYEVNRLENESDDLYRDAVSKLFANGHDALLVMKWKEIYELLENTLDECEDVANIVEGVVMKNV